MVHVLRQIHKALRPDGVLLDVHPVPKPPPLEVWRGDSRTLVGFVDWEHAIVQIRRARALLASVVNEGGLFRLCSRRFFDLRLRFTSVDAWLDHRKRFNEKGIVAPDLLVRARHEMRKGGILVITERARATMLTREQPFK